MRHRNLQGRYQRERKRREAIRQKGSEQREKECKRVHATIGFRKGEDKQQRQQHRRDDPEHEDIQGLTPAGMPIPEGIPPPNMPGGPPPGPNMPCCSPMASIRSCITRFNTVQNQAHLFAAQAADIQSDEKACLLAAQAADMQSDEKACLFDAQAADIQSDGKSLPL